MRKGSWIVALITALAISACERSAEPGVASITVYKSATCTCCRQWALHLRDAGFDVETQDIEDLRAITERVGVPADQGSCHTAEVSGYFIEGHVPAEDIKRLLAEHPDAKDSLCLACPRAPPAWRHPQAK